MKLYLDLYYPYENDTRYYVVAHGNGQAAQMVMLTDKSCKLAEPSNCWTFFVMLYATIDDAVCTYVGCSVFTNILDGPADMFNFKKKVIGQMTLEGGYRQLDLRPFISSSLSEKMSTLDMAVYSKSNSYDSNRQVFYMINTIYGNFPLVALPLYATMVTMTNSSVGWLEQCFESAMSIHGVENREVADLNVAGTAMTLLLQVLKYETDYQRGDIVKVAVDQWLNILLCPDMVKAGFDCEDGMLFVITMFHAICTCPAPTNSLVAYFAKKLRNYTVGSALCEILVGSDYVGHAVPVLIDTKQLKSRIAGKSLASSLPPLVIETTSWQTSIWERTRTENYLSIIANLDPSAKVLRPASDRMIDGTYRRIAKMQFPNFEGRCLSITVMDDDKSLNVSLYDFLVNNKGNVMINSLLDTVETEKLRQEMKEFPKFELPSQMRKYTEPDVVEGYPVLFDLANIKKFSKWDTQKIRVVGDLSIGLLKVKKR